jgi:hypothetical protein
MESINAKAIYLKNYGKLHPLRQNHLHKNYEVQNCSTRVITEQYATHHRTEKTKNFKNYSSVPEHTSFNFSAALSSSNSVAIKEKNILLKIAEAKSKKNSTIKK